MSIWSRKPKWRVDMEAVERTVRAEVEKEYAVEMIRLRGHLSFLRENATDEQLLHWAREAGKHVAPQDDEPDWERRYSEHLMGLLARMQELKDGIDKAVNDQDWDIKVFAKDGHVNAIGKIDREQVPALLYRMANQYAEGELGTSVEESLRFEVTKYLEERNAAREELAKLKGEQ